MSKVEQTLSLIKPDAVERNLEEEIKQFFIKSGFKIAKQKKVKLEKKDAEILRKSSIRGGKMYIKITPTVRMVNTNISFDDNMSPSSLAFSNLLWVGSWVFSWV